MYSFNEIRKIFDRCKNFVELEKVCDAFLLVIKDRGLTQGQEQYCRQQAHVRFRQLKV